MTATGHNNNKGAHCGNFLLRAVAWVSVAIFLAGCGGGSSGDPGSGSKYQASISYPSSSLVFVVGTTITPVVPTVSQGLASFTISPALPTGLSFNSSNGTVSGTPTATSADTSYTVTASGGGATATANVAITVNPIPPSSPSYGTAALTFTTQIAARTLTPTSKGGPVASWSISPALPAGLAFNTTDGAISGTPTTASAATNYIVTAENAGGQATVNLTVEIDSGVLLDVGHDSSIATLRMSGSNALSVDKSGHWNLWDYATGSEIASGDLYCVPSCDAPDLPTHLADMAGGTVVLAMQNGFEVLSASNGQVISKIAASPISWWSLASDGSYLAAGNSAGLFAWSPSGDSLAAVSGNYSTAVAFAAPGQIQVAEGPAGQNVIQTVSVPGGTSTVGPAFNTGQQFSSWFLDGSRFITTAGSTVFVYSQTGVQQAVMLFPSISTPFVGQGNWIWTVDGYGGQLQVFPVASSSTPAASLTIANAWGQVPSGTTLAVATGAESGFEVIDLSGSTLAETPYSNYTLRAYAAESTSEWMLGDANGVLIDGASLAGTVRYFDYGAVSSIVANAQFIAVATASGRIVYFDATTLTQDGIIPVSASQLALSSSGSVLAARQADGSIGIYSLPGASPLYTWPPPSGGATVFAIGLSASGATLTQVLWPSSGNLVNLQASADTGGSLTFAVAVDVGTGSPPFAPEVLISPNGTVFATTAGAAASGANGDPGTNLWTSNATLITGMMGYPIGWIDDAHLLVNTYLYPFAGAPVAEYKGCNVYAPSGASAGTCALPEVKAFQAISSDSIYAINLAEVLSVSSGSVGWMSGDATLQDSGPPTVGAVAGSHVVLLSGANVLAQGY